MEFLGASQVDHKLNGGGREVQRSEEKHNPDNPSVGAPRSLLSSRNLKLVPFGGERRICNGLPLAMRMLNLMLGSLINSFDWKLEDEVIPETMNMEEKFGLTLQMVQPLKASDR
ncbi:hypothetical protein ACFX13_021729 [Malus domestica]